MIPVPSRRPRNFGLGSGSPVVNTVTPGYPGTRVPGYSGSNPASKFACKGLLRMQNKLLCIALRNGSLCCLEAKIPCELLQTIVSSSWPPLSGRGRSGRHGTEPEKCTRLGLRWVSPQFTTGRRLRQQWGINTNTSNSIVDNFLPGYPYPGTQPRTFQCITACIASQ
eukprot:3931896-Rhodomonas_salina.1